MLRIVKTVQAAGKQLQDRAETFCLGSTHVLVVADGAGGSSGGAEAADFVTRRIREMGRFQILDSDSLSRLLERLDGEMAEKELYGETTCVVVAVTEDGLAGASVGDSGAWLISKMEADNLTSEQCRRPFLGSGRAKAIGFSRESFEGTLLVASDGLFKYTSIDMIEEVIRSADLDEALQKLIGLVRYPSGNLPDDLSIVLARKI